MNDHIGAPLAGYALATFGPLPEGVDPSATSRRGRIDPEQIPWLWPIVALLELGDALKLGAAADAN